MVDKNKKRLGWFGGLVQLLLVAGFVGLAMPPVCRGATAFDRLTNVVKSQPTYEVDKTNVNTLTDYIGNIVSVILGLLGTIFIILFVYAGYTWMMAAGNVEKVTKAKDTMRAAVLGLVITVAVYAIWIFIFAKIVKT